MAGQGFLFRWFKPCFGSGRNDQPETSIEGRNGKKDTYWLWQKKLARHLYGQYSMAVGQANHHNEDRCQLVSGDLTNAVNAANAPRGVFVGVYDGHGGTTCSQFILDNLFRNLKIAVTNHYGHTVNPAVILEAYQRTENSFVQYVRNNWHQKPDLAATGSCCLVGVVHNNILYVANAGDSRAVLARWADGDDFEVVQLSVDYNANDRDRRDEVRAELGNDPSLFRYVHGSARVRGTLQTVFSAPVTNCSVPVIDLVFVRDPNGTLVTRAIGDVYLKHNEFNRDPLPNRFKQQQPIVRPIVKAEPTVQTYQLGPDDRFIIFASDGLWAEIDNEEAVTLVKYAPRSGAANLLMREVLERAARKKELRYNEMRKMVPYERRYFHDDISVVILYLDNLEAAAAPDENEAQEGPGLSGRVNSMPVR